MAADHQRTRQELVLRNQLVEIVALRSLPEETAALRNQLEETAALRSRLEEHLVDSHLKSLRDW